jgi:steroid delta-isomerase-like uncharacterized protein
MTPPTAPHATVQHLFELLNRQQLDTAAELLAPDCQFSAPGNTHGDRQVWLGWLAGFLDAFGDLHHQLLATVEGSDQVAIELNVTGTHTKPLRGPQGEIPATGKPFASTAANLFQVRDGRITSYHIYFDQLGFLAQLGLLPHPPATEPLPNKSQRPNTPISSQTP